MGHVRVLAGKVNGGRIERLEVELLGIGRRTLDRDAVVRWMADGHSFVPVVHGKDQPALRLVEGPDEARYVRTDGLSEAADTLPDALSS